MESFTADTSVRDICIRIWEGAVSRMNLSQDIEHVVEDGKLISKDEVSFFAFKNRIKRRESANYGQNISLKEEKIKM